MCSCELLSREVGGNIGNWWTVGPCGFEGLVLYNLNVTVVALKFNVI